MLKLEDIYHLKVHRKKNLVLKVLDFEQPAVETLLSIEDNLVKIEPIEDEITIIEVLGNGLEPLKCLKQEKIRTTQVLKNKLDSSLACIFF